MWHFTWKASAYHCECLPLKALFIVMIRIDLSFDQFYSISNMFTLLNVTIGQLLYSISHMCLMKIIAASTPFACNVFAENTMSEIQKFWL